MLIIAHRGASVQRPENTISAFHYAADCDADVVEMDVRRTSDGVFIIFHDETLNRVDGSVDRVCELSHEELNQRLTAAAWPEVVTIDGLAREYKRTTPLLFHIKINGSEPELADQLDAIPRHFYLGVGSLSATRYFSQRYGRQRTLAFLPRQEDVDAYIQKGAGVIRLWESWLDQSVAERDQQDPTIAHCHRMGAAVWIMTKGSAGTGMTNATVLSQICRLGADGALLNDVHLAREWKQQQTGDDATS